ncbi:MAG: hypothetical protein KF886_20780 [Candidatus Hydrogenedentes bacterium]|nr:hypothetical protein [Candidatus Hydrogenedentota bacterium]
MRGLMVFFPPYDSLRYGYLQAFFIWKIEKWQILAHRPELLSRKARMDTPQTAQKWGAIEEGITTTGAGQPLAETKQS